MSAYVVDHSHIDFLAYHACKFNPMSSKPSYYYKGEWKDIAGSQQIVGEILLAENVRSVNYRYQENNEPDVYEYEYPTRRIVPFIEIVAACDTYAYQACETPDWKDTEAYAILHHIREQAIRSMQGYSEAGSIYDDEARFAKIERATAKRNKLAQAVLFFSSDRGFVHPLS